MKSTHKVVDVWVANKPTWDRLFAVIAPNLLNEAEERVLQAKIEAFLLTEYYADNRSALVEAANEVITSAGPIEADNLEDWTATVTGTDFETILIQLMALGLIRRSERNRSGAYWGLTPYGETRTVQLRAITKPSTTSSVSANAGTD